MKRLYLLRHAEAAPAHGFSDFERTLTDRGIAQSAALGEAMKARFYAPAQIYCSAATRTRQTLEGLGLAVKTEFSPRIYNEGLGVLFSLIQETDDAVQSILIVAHNPSIYELAVRLAGEEKPENLSRLQGGYAPATLSVLDCPIEKWNAIRTGENILSDILVSMEYMGSK